MVDNERPQLTAGSLSPNLLLAKARCAGLNPTFDRSAFMILACSIAQSTAGFAGCNDVARQWLYQHPTNGAAKQDWTVGHVRTDRSNAPSP